MNILGLFGISVLAAGFFEISHCLVSKVIYVNVPKEGLCRVYWVVVLVMGFLLTDKSFWQALSLSHLAAIALVVAVHVYLNEYYGLSFQIRRRVSSDEYADQGRREELISRVREMNQGSGAEAQQ